MAAPARSIVKISPLTLFTLLKVMTIQTKAQNQTSPCPARSISIVHLMPGDFENAEILGFKTADLPDGVFKTLTDSSKTVTAVLTSAPMKTAMPFDQVLAGANAALGPRDRLELAVQVKNETDWSPWFEFGVFSPSGDKTSLKGQQNPFGRMEIDTLVLSSKNRYLRYRITLTAEAASQAFLRLVSVTYTDTAAPYNEACAIKKPAAFKQVRLDVPVVSQMAQQVDYSKDICSPASLTMVLNRFGLRTQVLNTAACVLDATENIYGNWTFNTMYAGGLGLYAWPARFDSLEEAALYLSAGIPLVASVTFGPDELKRSPLKKTRGHLLVIKGFNAKGDILANDPAAPDEKTVERVYDRKEFARAWLKNKSGTAYIITPFSNMPLTARPPLAELFAKPLESGKDDKASFIESQILPLENVRFGETRNAWLKVEASEQPHKENRADKNLTPYSGWIEARLAAFRPLMEPDAVIRTKRASIKEGGLSELSIGTRVRILGRDKNPFVRILLPGGDNALISEKDLNLLPIILKSGDLRKKIIETARQFLGDKYYWGGRSGYGIDCSGLINVIYRVWGLDLPRNADDQLSASFPVKPETMLPGDLIFSSKAGNHSAIDHVMLYSGSGMLIEATKDTGTVREATFAEKFGADFKKAKNGMTAREKKIFFRRVIKQEREK